MTARRKLGPVLATIVVAGNMIGSGIFMLPATLAGVGSVTLIGWAAASIGAIALALLFAKLARRQPMAGGPASYIFDAFGPQRCFWGTDVTRMPCTYRQCVTMFTEELPWLKGNDLELVMGRAVCEWLGWKHPALARS